MLKKVVDLTSQDFSKGLSTISNILNLSKDQSPNMMNVKVNFDGSLEKRLGSSTMNSVVIALSGGSSWLIDSDNSLSSDIQSYWKLDEPSGTRQDSFGNNPLTDNNNVGQASGIRNAGALISSNYLSHDNNASLQTGDINFSFSTWFYLNSTSTSIQRTILSKRDAGAGANVVLLLHLDSSNFVDSSLDLRTVTTAGSVSIDTSTFKFSPGSLRLPGGTDYLTVDMPSFSTDDMTIDFWAKFNTHNSQNRFFTLGSDNSLYFAYQTIGGGRIDMQFPGATASQTLPTDTNWHHYAVVRSSNLWSVFVDGSKSISNITASNSIVAQKLFIGVDEALTSQTDGWIDEFRVSNTAKFVANFTVPTSAYPDSSPPQNFEYWLYVNTDQMVVFEVSSSGTAQNGRVIASSFGAVTTATWYNAVAWHDTGNNLGLAINLTANTVSYSDGVRAGSAPFVIGSISNGTSNFFDGRIDETGFWKKLLTDQQKSDLFGGGSGNTYSEAFNSNPWASFDFGASANRWLTVSAGTGIYASSDLGVNFVTIATSRTATYQSFERSKNILIATSDAYDTPLIWPGSAGTFMTIFNVSAPLAKYCINFQGFTILMNTNSRKRAFYYEDENTHITGDWGDSFDLPSSADDETTGAFVLRGTLYVSTRYSIFRMSYVGGNPDWSFRKIKDWGFVPRTAKIVTIKDVGEVCCGMSWDRKLRLFDGSDDKIISDNIENNNMLCDFAMDNVSLAGSGLVVSFAEHDNNDQNYKLCLSIGANSTETTHFINYNGRTQSFFPYDNMGFNTMVMAESANQQYLMAFDRAGYCHMMDSGNLDGNRTPINDIFDSSLLFEKSPSEVSKSQKIDFYLSPTSSGTLFFRDRVDFSSDFKPHDKFELNDTSNKIMIKKSINIPKTQGVYQWQLTSSANTANPWKINRTDYFLTGLGIGQSETSK